MTVRQNQHSGTRTEQRRDSPLASPRALALLRPVKENSGPRAPGVKSVQMVRQISSCTDPGSQVALFFAIVPMYSVSASSFAARASNCARLS